ncbi:MAG: isoaspartyl peptidase/L-asparaginase [Nitrospirota bacterium]
MILVVHGGAGDRAPGPRALNMLTRALTAGYRLLEQGGSALDAVVEAIVLLEDSGVFNAGRGGRVQLDGTRRLDAALMEGKQSGAGAVIGLEGIRNPIRAARVVMELPNIVFTHIGARRIAEAEGLELLPEPEREDLAMAARDKKRRKEAAALFEKYFSTVGAVACDLQGTVAAGSSTGGVAAMLPGRVGDTPVIGAGIYAENGAGAVACTGTGEAILRRALAKELCMELRQMTARRAAALSLKRLGALGGSAGVIVLDHKGRPELAHTTAYMASGYISERGMRVGEAFRRIAT